MHLRCQGQEVQDPLQAGPAREDDENRNQKGQDKAAHNGTGDFFRLPSAAVICHDRRKCLDDPIQTRENRHPDIGSNGHAGKIDGPCLTGHDGIEKIHARNGKLCDEDGDHDVQDPPDPDTESRFSKKQHDSSFQRQSASIRTGKEPAAWLLPCSILHSANWIWRWMKLCMM